MSNPKRLTPTKETIKMLLLRSGNQCAFSDCNHVIFNDQDVLVAECCHIEAAMPGGERYNSLQTDEDRRSIDNLLFLCHQHHVETDDVDIYTVERLKNIKLAHENQFRGTPISINSNKTNQILFSIEQALQKQWKREVNSYLYQLEAFRPQTVLSLLNKFLQDLRGERTKPSDDLLAHVYYQKGICYQLLGQKDKAYKNFINASELNINEDLYRDQALFSYFMVGDIKIAEEMTNEVLKTDSINIIAWSVKLLLTAISDIPQLIANIPSLVKRDILFHQIVFNYYATTNIKVLDLFEDDIFLNVEQLKTISLTVTIETLDQAIYIVNRLFTLFIRNYNYINFKQIEGVSEDVFKLLSSVLSKITTALDNSELKEKHNILYSLHAFSNYILTKDKKYALEMKDRLNISPNIESAYYLICANILQIEKEYDEPLKLLSEVEPYMISDRDKFASYILKATVYMKQGTFEKQTGSYQRAIISIEKVDEYLVLAYINILIMLKLTDVLTEEVVNSALSKKYTSAFNEKVIVAFSNCLFATSEIGHEKQIEEIIQEADKDTILLLYIADLYHIVGAHDKAIYLYEKYLILGTQSRELYLYIRSLYETQNNFKKLIELLERWRLNFDYNEQLLRLEYSLVSSMLDWKSALRVCEYALDFNPSNEEFLRLIIFVLDKMDSPMEELDKYVDKYISLDIVPVEYIPSIADIILRKLQIDKAVDLVFDNCQDDSSLQILLFTLSSLYRNRSKVNNKFKEHDKVEIGSFVRYQINGRDAVIEVKENVDYNGENLTEAILGKKKNDIISLKARYSDIPYDFKIIGIMDKYSYKMSQIMEGFNNPLQTPFETIDVKEKKDISEINKLLQEQYGKQGDERLASIKEVLSKYYEGEQSLYVLVQGLFNDSYIKAFNKLKSSSGIRITPMNLYSTNIMKDSIFLIDLSSLPILYEINRGYKVEYSNLYISKHHIEILKNELNDLKRLPYSDLSLSISSEGVYPIKEEESFEQKVLYYENIISWTETNCIAIVEEKTVDAMMRNKDREDKGLNFCYNYFINTLFIRQEKNAILITDDSAYLTMGIPLECISISTELYIKSLVDENHECLYVFIKNRYVGFNYTPKQLLDLFNKERTQAGDMDLYSFTINNLGWWNIGECMYLLIYFLTLSELTIQEQTFEVERLMKAFLTKNKNNERVCEIFPKGLKYCEFILNKQSNDLLKKCFNDILVSLNKFDTIE